MSNVGILKQSDLNGALKNDAPFFPVTLSNLVYTPEGKTLTEVLNELGSGSSNDKWTYITSVVGLTPDFVTDSVSELPPPLRAIEGIILNPKNILAELLIDLTALEISLRGGAFMTTETNYMCLGITINLRDKTIKFEIEEIPEESPDQDSPSE